MYVCIVIIFSRFDDDGRQPAERASAAPTTRDKRACACVCPTYNKTRLKRRYPFQPFDGPPPRIQPHVFNALVKTHCDTALKTHVTHCPMMPRHIRDRSYCRQDRSTDRKLGTSQKNHRDLP